jgi:AraC-like DNA-binding protein
MTQPSTMHTGVFSFEASDLDAARAAVGANYFNVSLDLAQPGTPYQFRFHGVTFGALSVGEAWNSAGLRIGMSDIGTGYYVNFPRSGRMEAQHRGSSLIVTPDGAAVYQPVGDIRMCSTDDYDSYAVKIGSTALESELEALLGHPVKRPLRLALGMDVAHGPGKSWAGLVRLLAAEATTQRGLLSQPLIIEPLHEAVLRGLLLAVEHPHRDALVRPVGSWAPGPVKRAVDVMQAHPDHPFTTATLAEIAGVSVRTLQEGFRRHLGISPTDYLRQVRLARVHRDLCHSDPTQITVTEIAYRWGFAHLGRFAGAYRAKYGVPPSYTLHHAA